MDTSTEARLRRATAAITLTIDQSTEHPVLDAIRLLREDLALLEEVVS